MRIALPSEGQGRSKVIAASHSWRGVLRDLELCATSGAMIRSVRRRADRLVLDYSHFTGQRGWKDSDLAVALAESDSWNEVAQRLGLADGGSSEQRLKGHARRLGLDAGHLLPGHPGPVPAPCRPPARLAYLPRAGSLLAAAWFTLRGCDVAWPLEPCRYDLIATMEGRPQRIQVKTTRTRAGSTWKVDLSSARRGRMPYDPDEIDCFFAIDGDFAFYLIPVAVVGGLHMIHLSAYSGYRLDQLQPAA